MSTGSADLSKLRLRRETSDDRRPPVLGRAIIVVVILAAVAAGVIWFLSARRAMTVSVATASASGGGATGAAGSISANGYVVARTKASVAAKIAGRLAYLGVSEGANVRAGEVIARLEHADYAAAVRAASARLATTRVQLADARSKLARAQELQRQGLLSEQQLEDATTLVHTIETQVESGRADLALAQASLENTNIRAPFDGTVLRKDAEVGEIVAPSAGGGSGLTRTAIVTIADLATLEVEVDVNEAYIAQVQNGQAARITLDAYPDTSFSGRVRQVVPTANREKATVLVKVSILDHDPRILPEMGAQVAFALQSAATGTVAPPRRVTVPSAAVVGSGSSARVWVVQDNTARARTVATGATRGEQVEVTSGLTDGETVILHPPAALREGTRVRIARDT